VRAEIDKRAIAVLSGGHLAVDFAAGALPAMLPFLASKFDLSYTLTGTIVLASTLAASFPQLAFGLWSDRRGAYWLLPAGVAVAGVGMALAALSPSYGLLLVFVVVSGLGTAAYHPEASKFAAFASGRRRASGMSLFSVGGNLGYGLGPVITGPLVAALGLAAAAFVAGPTLLAAGALIVLAPFILSFAPDGAGRTEARGSGVDRPGAVALLLAVVAFRSVAWFGLLTFVPLWEVSQGHSEAHGSWLLALMLLSGGVGTLIAGPAADRFGLRTVLFVSTAVIGPAILVFVVVGGVAGALALALVGAAVVGTFGVTMVISQEYLPRHIGLASGLSIGLSIGLGGIAAVFLGALADAVDLETAFYVCAVAPLAGLVLAALLPPTRPHPRLEPEIAAP
jgi:FSR family fosmidomycin resistance protein-like MFS transporter